VAKRRKPSTRSRELTVVDALITVHVDPSSRDRHRRRFRSAQKRLSERADAFVSRQKAN
jgi:hypothetical protein